MIVELSLLAPTPAALVGIYHGFQLLRPKWGRGSDQRLTRTPWILSGMVILAIGTVGAASATARMEAAFSPALGLGVVAFAMVGLGPGAAATNLLALFATRVARGARLLRARSSGSS